MRCIIRLLVPCLVVAAVAAAVLARSEAPPTTDTDGLRPLSEEGDDPTIRVGHNPPLLVLPGEPVTLSFDVVCAIPETYEGRTCDRSGDVYVRSAGSFDYERLPLAPGGEANGYRLHADIPDSYLTGAGFEYYAELRGPERTAVLPAGGRRTPYRAHVLTDPVTVPLGAQGFDELRSPDAVAYSAPWGTGPDELGLDAGPEQLTIGPSSFDVTDDGTVVVLDQVNGRVVRARPDGTTSRTEMDVTSAMPDLAVGPAGTLFVLESSNPSGGNPLLKRFSSTGALVAATPIAEEIPSKVRMGLLGPYVYQYPSAMWRPVEDGSGGALAPVEQIRRETFALIGSGGVGTIVKALPDEIRVAVTDGDAVLESWRVLAPTVPVGAFFGEVQLAEATDGGVVLVTAVATDDEGAFRVLALTPDGVVEDMTVDRGSYAAMASVSRFRLSPDGDLYQLRTSGLGAEVVRFDTGGWSR